MMADPEKTPVSPRLLPGQDGTHITFCRICEAFCGLTAEVRDGRIVKVGPDRNSPHSRGHICVKGPAMMDVTYDKDRITKPKKRVGEAGEFVDVEWDEALDDIASRQAAILASYGDQASAAYLGNPKAFNIGSSEWRSILRPMGFNKYFSAGSQDSNARHVACYVLYGSVVQQAFPDLPSCDHLLIFGANPLVSHGSVLTAPRMLEDLAAVAERGRVIVIDPRETETAARFEHLSIRTGTDAWMLGAMVNTLFDEGLADLNFLRERTLHWETLRDRIKPLDAELAERQCGIPADRIRRMAREFAAAPRAAAYSRLGLCRGQYSTLANLLVDSLNIVGGKFGRRGGWVLGEPAINLARLLPGGYGEQHSRIGNLPSVVGNLPSIVMPDEILVPGEGQVRALTVVSGNPVVSAPAPARLEAALEQLELFFSIDLYINETNRHAHYVLPSTSFFEREDLPLLGFAHMVRPYAQYTDAVIPPIGECRHENDILDEIARRFHAARGTEPERLEAHGTREVLARLDDLMRKGEHGDGFGARPDGLSVEKLRQARHGILFSEQLALGDWSEKVHADGKIHLWDTILEGEIERMVAHQPPGNLVLFGRRDIRSINSWMHNVDRLTRSQRPTLLIHPNDAVAHGLRNGDVVQIDSDIASMEALIEVTDAVREGAVCYPHGWGHNGSWLRANAMDGGNVNRLAPDKVTDVEQVSGASFLDGFPVALRKMEREA